MWTLSGITVPPDGAWTMGFGTTLVETIMNNAESLYCLIRALDHNAQGHAGYGISGKCRRISRMSTYVKKIEPLLII